MQDFEVQNLSLFDNVTPRQRSGPQQNGGGRQFRYSGGKCFVMAISLTYTLIMTITAKYCGTKYAT